MNTRSRLLCAMLLLSTSACSSLPSKSLQTQQSYQSVVISASMLPVIQVGQVITVEPADYDSLKAGQIAVYRPFGSHSPFNRVHRLTRKRGDYWIAKGDNNQRQDDSFVCRENFVGVVKL